MRRLTARGLLYGRSKWTARPNLICRPRKLKQALARCDKAQKRLAEAEKRASSSSRARAPSLVKTVVVSGRGYVKPAEEKAKATVLARKAVEDWKGWKCPAVKRVRSAVGSNQRRVPRHRTQGSTSRLRRRSPPRSLTRPLAARSAAADDRKEASPELTEVQRRRRLLRSPGPQRTREALLSNDERRRRLMDRLQG